MKDKNTTVSHIFALSAGCLCMAAIAADVEFKDTSISLPTYVSGAPDKTPVFYTGRVYQGAQGRVYPYPMQDTLTDERRDEKYRYLTLENEWLHLGILPEHGGHLLNLTDKQTGFETFYRQHVIKPALIGMNGAWISGGVEWNFPHHHRASSSLPIDWSWEARDNGVKTIWLGETELRRRLKWTIGLSLMPDRAVLEAQNIFMNRGPFIESMLYWANVAVHCGNDYQVIFPPSCHLGFDHHKSSWTSFPMGPRTTGAGDAEIIDLGWWRNFTTSSRSIFAMDPDNDWLVGYDHAKNAGTAHVSNRQITVGKKFFLWGNYPAAQMWDSKVLTDTDGPYLELMVGCWSDNQPDYSWIAPYETRRVKQFWYPVKGIGGVKNATIDGAVNFERRGGDEFLLGFHSTRELKNCRISVTENGRETFVESGVAIGPNSPWCRMVKVSKGVKDTLYTAKIADADGKTFVEYTPVGEDPHDPLPKPVESPKDPKEYSSAELAYLVGLRLEQFHNGVVDPMPYYRRALEIDPDYSAANLIIGLNHLKRGEYAAAARFLRKAADRVNQNYTRAKDVESEYYLALAMLGQGRLKESQDLLWRVTWRATHKKEAFVEIARILCRERKYAEARDILEESALPLAAEEAKLHTLRAYVSRKLGNAKTAATALTKAIACDPLEYWGVCEGAFLKSADGAGALAAAGENRGLKAQQLMEALSDYMNLAAWPEVSALADQALTVGGDSYSLPLIAYFKAFALEKMGRTGEASAQLAAAEKMATDYCFPSRLEELEVLEWAAKRTDAKRAESSNTAYYLGEILWNLDRKDEAIASWRKAIAAKANHALALRCLAFAVSHPGTYFDSTGVPTGVKSEEAAELYRRAIAADPGNARTLLEADLAFKRVGVSAAERLKSFTDHRATAEKYDPCLAKMAQLFNQTGDYDEALRLLVNRHFHVWEGGADLHGCFVDALVRRGERKMAANDLKGARKDFEMALTYPDNLEKARPNNAGTEPRVHWALAECAKREGRADERRRELELVLERNTGDADMRCYRALALKALGRNDEAKKELDKVRGTIDSLGKPEPRVKSAYAKFGGEESHEERAASRASHAESLRRRLREIEEGK